MFKSKSSSKSAHTTPLVAANEPPMPSFNSVFAMVHMDEGTMHDAAVSKKTWTVSLTCSDADVGAALQHGVNEINAWLFGLSAKPALEQVVVLVFAMMADMSFVAVPGVAELSRTPQFHLQQVTPPFQLAPTQRFLFTRAPAHTAN